VFDSCFFVDDKALDVNIFIQTDMVKRLMSSLFLECSYLKSISDFWLFIGMVAFVSDIYLLKETDDFNFQDNVDKKRNIYYKWVREGKDQITLIRPGFMHPAEAFYDECYILKSSLIFYLMYSHLKLTTSNVADFICLPLIERIDNCKPTSDLFKDTKHFFKKARTTFGVRNLKANLSQFLYNTGCSEFDCVYSYNRKENKMKLTLRQTPMQLEYYKQAQESRFKLEKFFNKISPVQKLLENYRNQLHKLQEESGGIIENENVMAF
jgi:hypothetical protein